MTDCIFCKIINGEIPSHKIYKDENTLAFLDISNDAYGHTLVIPKTHCTNILDADDKIIEDVFKTVKKISNHYVNNCGFNGVNILNANDESAGQSVFHLHIHIFPRKKEDGIKIYPNLSKKDYDLKEVAKTLKI